LLTFSERAPLQLISLVRKYSDSTLVFSAQDYQGRYTPQWTNVSFWPSQESPPWRKSFRLFRSQLFVWHHRHEKSWPRET